MNGASKSKVYIAGALTLIGIAGVVARLIQLIAPNDFLRQSEIGDWFSAHLSLLLCHIIGAVSFLMLFPVQYILARKTRYRAHKTTGYVATTLAGIGFTFTIVLALIFPFGALLTQVTTAAVAALVLFSLYKGLAAAITKDIAAHKQWMQRCYLLLLMTSIVRIQLILGKSLNLTLIQIQVLGILTVFVMIYLIFAGTNQRTLKRQENHMPANI